MLLFRVCPGCGGSGRGLCRACVGQAAPAARIDDLPELDATFALFAYDPRLQRILVAAKNGGRRDLTTQLGGLLAASMQGKGVPFDVVTWVPASRSGQRRRGYDQGRFLARATANGLNLSHRRLLLRRKGESQGERGRLGRMAGPELRAPLGAPARVLVVDDVVTTGGSLVAAATALRDQGARSVVGLAVARADLKPGVPTLTAAGRGPDR